MDQGLRIVPPTSKARMYTPLELLMFMRLTQVLVFLKFAFI